MPRFPRFDERAQTSVERGNVDLVCHHLALVAIYGATDEVALTLDPAFCMHIDGIDIDRWGYLSLIEANHAAHVTYPPLDVAGAWAFGEVVTARLVPRCMAHFRLADEVITESWMTTDWHAWRDWLTGQIQI